MAFTNSTSHFGLPQYIGTDRPKYLTDVNNAYKKIDDEIYNAQTEAKAADASAEQANTNANSALTNANAAVEVANLANETAKTAQETATTAENTANTANQTATQAETTAGNAVAVANNANTLAGEAQASANKAIADSATAVKVGGNIANAYDATKTYAVGDYCMYNGVFYKCVTAITSAHAFNVDEWDDVTVGEEIGAIGGFDPSEINKKIASNTDTIATHTEQLDGLYFGQNDSGEYGYSTTKGGTIVPFKKSTKAEGNATAGDVLSGKTFSNADAMGVIGTMKNNGSETVELNPTTNAKVTQTLEGGYYDSITITSDGSTAYQAGYKAGHDITEKTEVVYEDNTRYNTTGWTADRDYSVLFIRAEIPNNKTFYYEGEGTVEYAVYGSGVVSSDPVTNYVELVNVKSGYRVYGGDWNSMCIYGTWAVD